MNRLFRSLCTLLCLHACGVPEDVAPEGVETESSSEAVKNCPPEDYPCVDTGEPDPDICNAKVTGTLSTSSTAVNFGQSVTLSWSVTLPRDCTASGWVRLDGETVALSGSKTITPLASRAHLLQFDYRNLASQNVAVSLAGMSRVRIDGNTAEHLMLLKQAAGTPNMLVLLQPNVDLYVSSIIHVADNVTISSEAPPPGNAPVLARTLALPGLPFTYSPLRSSLNPGPRLRTTQILRPMLQLNGANVSLRGFRVEGPEQGEVDGSGRGIWVRSSAVIDDLEVSGFSESAIYVDGFGRTTNSWSDVEIKNCFIHHNQHVPGGAGYGVVTKAGGAAVIRNNVFDFNRHSIASDGDLGSKYQAIDNLVLRGGGRHCNETVDFLCWQTHAFDVHGSDNCGLSSWADSALNCGRAGTQFQVIGNTFQYSSGTSFKLRGTPTIGASVWWNVFADNSSGNAVQWTERAPELVGNVFGRDTYGKYGSCDVDGDGRTDLLFGSGRTWWFSSAGQREWRFLSSNNEQLSDVLLGDFDRDGRCDLLRSNTSGWQISSGGKATWATIPNSPANVPVSELRAHDFDGDGFPEIFRRLSSGQWVTYSPQNAAQRLLNSSTQPLNTLHFGDFDGDRKTDILSASGGVWKWSKSGIAGWLPLATRSDTPAFIGNFDGVGGDDVLRVVESGPVDDAGARGTYQFQLSSGGSGAWVNFGPSVQAPKVSSFDVGAPGSFYQRPFFAPGSFGTTPKENLLRVDQLTRVTSQFTVGQSAWVNHSVYPR